MPPGVLGGSGHEHDARPPPTRALPLGVHPPLRLAEGSGAPPRTGAVPSEVTVLIAGEAFVAPEAFFDGGIPGRHFLSSSSSSSSSSLFREQPLPRFLNPTTGGSHDLRRHLFLDSLLPKTNNASHNTRISSHMLFFRPFSKQVVADIESHTERV
ncbi:hypothetical protein GW17_00058241 [Ensete ventricosum]|nr:hypothetical protein GW17_00058241 [Ensete ventricosum]RZS12867.1 hypothetical protein BHM03_00044374 [Ensete ventricosum]